MNKITTTNYPHKILCAKYISRDFSVSVWRDAGAVILRLGGLLDAEPTVAPQPMANQPLFHRVQRQIYLIFRPKFETQLLRPVVHLSISPLGQVATQDLVSTGFAPRQRLRLVAMTPLCSLFVEDRVVSPHTRLKDHFRVFSQERSTSSPARNQSIPFLPRKSKHLASINSVGCPTHTSATQA